MFGRTTSLLAVGVLTWAGVAVAQGDPTATADATIAPADEVGATAGGSPTGSGAGGDMAAPDDGGGTDGSGVGAPDESDPGVGGGAEAVAAAAEDDDELGFDDFEVEHGEPAMVVPDFDQPQPEGLGREPQHDHRWMWHNLTAVRVNPLGLINRFRTGYQLQLSHRPEPIFYDSYGSLQLDTELGPAFGYVGSRLEVQPVKLFNFWASYGFIGNFGTFSHTRSFANAGEDYSDSLLSDTRDRDYAAAGHRATLSGMFQVGIAGLAMRSNVKAYYSAVNLKGDDKVQWDATLDVLIPNQGWVVTTDTDLLAVTDFDLIIGVRHTFTHALYREEHLGGQANENTPTHRVGPALIYTFFDDGPGTAWNKPTLVLLTQWWAQHRFRTSQSPGLPYLLLAFVQQGDFMISDLK